jgi:AmmeMemoRadiSam system protein A
MHPLVELAKEAITEYIKSGKKIKPPSPLPEPLKERAGVFVSIKKEGALRGCIGTYMPYRKNIAEEVIENAVAAATADPRFLPITEDELPQLQISVDVLSSPEEVKDTSSLDPKKYGVIVECGVRRGLLLPDLEGVDTVQEQLRIARVKAGIGEDEPIKIYRFTVHRYI